MPSPFLTLRPLLRSVVARQPSAATAAAACFAPCTRFLHVAASWPPASPRTSSVAHPQASTSHRPITTAAPEPAPAAAVAAVAGPEVGDGSVAVGDDDAPAVDPHTLALLDDVPVVRPRLEAHLYENLLPDLMALMYRHDSPFAPSIAELDRQEENRRRAAETQPSPLRDVFSVPLAELPTRPWAADRPTTHLLTRVVGRSDVRRLGHGWRKIRRNDIDYTTVRRNTFDRYFRRLERSVIHSRRAFERHFSPRPEHLPAVRKIVLRVWDEKAIENKNLLIGSIMSLQAMTGVPATPLFAEKADAARKLRAGMPLGAKAELTGARAYEFLDKLAQVVLPRLREWNGVRLELPRQRPLRPHILGGTLRFTIPAAGVGAFPDIEPHFDMYPRLNPVEVSVYTTAGSRRAAALLLSGFQVPFDVVEVDPPAKEADGADDVRGRGRRKDRNSGRVVGARGGRS
ncbi:hypothetical protein HK405_010102, partial [Cladochytrium tenue]